MERTFVILKPDAVQRNLLGNIISRIENKGLLIKELKMVQLDKELIKAHYSHISHLSIWNDIISFMISGPAVLMIVEGTKAVDEIRRLMGTTFDAVPGTIRGDLSLNSEYGANLIHGSDSVENAIIEIERFSKYLK